MPRIFGEPVFIDADGDEVAFYVEGGSSVELRNSRTATAFQTVTVGSRATLRASCWAVSAGAYSDVRQSPSSAATQSQLASSIGAITGVVYDSSGNITSITEGGATTAYTYDAAGNVLTESRGGVTRTFTYDGSGNLSGATIS